MSTIVELKAIAKSMGVKGFSVMKKAELIKSIEQQKTPASIDMVAAAPAESKVAPEAPAQEKKEKKERKANPWNAYLAEYRTKNNMSLKQAMAGAKEEYAKSKGEKTSEPKAK